MTWFKVDDGLHKHRKRIRLGVNAAGFAAMGLWTIAGSWSSDELTEGWIPDDVLDYLAPGFGRRLAERLVRAGLWHRLTRDGEDGHQFHDWADTNPTREEALATSKAKSVGGAVGNHRRWHVERGKVDPTCPYCTAVPGQLVDRRTDRSSDSVPNRPTRPVPSRKTSPSSPSVDPDDADEAWAQELAWRVTELRRDWLVADVLKALAHPKVRQRPPAIVEQALLLLAADERTERPSRLAANHGLWARARQEATAEQRRRSGDYPPHPHTPDSAGVCTECPLPKRHAVHREEGNPR